MRVCYPPPPAWGEGPESATATGPFPQPTPRTLCAAGGGRLDSVGDRVENGAVRLAEPIGLCPLPETMPDGPLDCEGAVAFRRKGLPPWRSDDWLLAGRRLREAWRALRRISSLKAFPVGAGFPPRVVKDKSPRTSQPERYVLQLEEAESRYGVSVTKVSAALVDLMAVEFECWYAVKLVDWEGMSRREVARNILQRSETSVSQLVARGWGFIAWRLFGRAGGA